MLANRDPEFCFRKAPVVAVNSGFAGAPNGVELVVGVVVAPVVVPLPIKFPGDGCDVNALVTPGLFFANKEVL